MGNVVELADRRRQKKRDVRRRAAEFDAACEPADENFERLLYLTDEAWQWRDPDSLRDLADQLRICAAQVEAEWQEPVLIGLS